MIKVSSRLAQRGFSSDWRGPCRAFRSLLVQVPESPERSERLEVFAYSRRLNRGGGFRKARTLSGADGHLDKHHAVDNERGGARGGEIGYIL